MIETTTTTTISRRLNNYRHLALPTSLDPRKKTRRPFGDASTYCNYSLESNIAIRFSLTATDVMAICEASVYIYANYIYICYVLSLISSTRSCVRGYRCVCVCGRRRLTIRVDGHGSIGTCCVMTAMRLLRALLRLGAPVRCRGPSLQMSQLVVQKGLEVPAKREMIILL